MKDRGQRPEDRGPRSEVSGQKAGKLTAQREAFGFWRSAALEVRGKKRAESSKQNRQR